MQLKKSSFATLSNEALCKIRDEIEALLDRRTENLRRELDRVTFRVPNRKKVTPKYRGPNGETWSGRGMLPRWLTSQVKQGKKPEDFLIAASEMKERV
jgi:DNA-binding protein H-NS